MDLDDFLNHRKKLVDAGNTEELAVLESKASRIVQQFLDEAYVPLTDLAPYLYTFFTTFSQTNNLKLKLACNQALEKLQPALDEFDEENGLTHLDELTDDIVSHNQEQLKLFETLNPFEKDEKNQLKFPDFADLLRLTDEIEITGAEEDDIHDRFINTLTGMARLQTFTKLSLSPEKINQDTYLSTLRFHMEADLVTMLVADKAEPTSLPNDKKMNELQAEYQKLLNVLNASKEG